MPARVLDIDLDFFVREVVYWPDQRVRPDPEVHPVWPIDDAIAYLRKRCLLNGQLPGFVTENHGELFPLWRRAIERELLVPPFHVTHLDAHADLGMGDAGYVYLTTELVRLPLAQRTSPPTGFSGLNDGNHLAFSIACRWLSDLTYVYGEGGGSDEPRLLMEGFDMAATSLQVPMMSPGNLDRFISGGKAIVDGLEPPVPYRSLRDDAFQAEAPYDFICLTRSPPYAPVTADPLYEAIIAEFVGGHALG